MDHYLSKDSGEHFLIVTSARVFVILTPHADHVSAVSVPEFSHLQAASGSIEFVFASKFSNLCFSGRKFRASCFLRLDDQYPLLGADFLYENHFIVDFSNPCLAHASHCTLLQCEPDDSSSSSTNSTNGLMERLLNSCCWQGLVTIICFNSVILKDNYPPKKTLNIHPHIWLYTTLLVHPVWFLFPHLPKYLSLQLSDTTAPQLLVLLYLLMRCLARLIFIRIGSHSPPLQQPDCGPYQLLSLDDKTTSAAVDAHLHESS